MRQQRLREGQPLGQDTEWVSVGAKARDLATISPSPKSRHEACAGPGPELALGPQRQIRPSPHLCSSLSGGRENHAQNYNLVGGAPQGTVAKSTLGGHGGGGGAQLRSSNDGTAIRSRALCAKCIL